MQVKVKGSWKMPVEDRYPVSRFICSAIRLLGWGSAGAIAAIGIAAAREGGFRASTGIAILAACIVALAYGSLIHVLTSGVIALFDIANNTAKD